MYVIYRVGLLPTETVFSGEGDAGDNRTGRSSTEAGFYVPWELATRQSPIQTGHPPTSMVLCIQNYVCTVL
jgi:hypothetical protein